MTSHRIDRRHFLRMTSLGIGAAGLMPRLGVAPSLAAGTPAFADYRALVCVFLFGGNDSFNMVVPRSPAEHALYAASRQKLALAADVLRPIVPATSDGAQYGLHPAMTSLGDLFDQGELAVVGNVGTLLQPATKQQVLDGSVRLPPQLFSHNDQQDQWQYLAGAAPLRTGWAGRVADALRAQLSNETLSLNLSLFGSNALQSGVNGGAFAVGADGAPTLAALTGGIPFAAQRRQVFERLLAVNYPSPITRALVDVHQRALATADRVNTALAGAQAFQLAFPGSDLGRQLQEVARLISVKDTLNASRQIFLVGVGGFDTHDDHLKRQQALLADLDAGLSAFAAALRQIGRFGQVTTFTHSDFGRTLTSNGDGTDHGWGSHQLVMGGAVKGGDIHGRMPDLTIGGPDDLDAGRMIPAQSVDQYVATLVRWFGLDEAQVDAVVPNLGAFASRDLGFMA